MKFPEEKPLQLLAIIGVRVINIYSMLDMTYDTWHMTQHHDQLKASEKRNNRVDKKNGHS